MSRKLRWLLLSLIWAAATIAYANHFHNGFHFDDSHTVVDNPAIRSLANIPRFFTDTTSFSVLPANRTYRPFVSTTLAIDYSLAGGYKPFCFQLSTFVFFLAMLGCMASLYRRIVIVAAPERLWRADAAALFATAWCALHPAMAETVNYVIQRGDVYCAFGVTAALALYACWPQGRRTGLYLAPFAFALLSKPPAIIFPLLLLLYIYLFEVKSTRRRSMAWAAAASFAVGGALMLLQKAMTPRSYLPSTLSAHDYYITQPYVLWRYVCQFFAPTHLNVDTDLQPFATLTPEALLGFLFVAAMVTAACFYARSQILKPIAFGLLWFLIASAPTSLYKLSEVENDHRMFLPFIGLALAVAWAMWLIADRVGLRAELTDWRRGAVAASLLLTLCGYGYATHMRNRVWSSDEALWRDDVEKSPSNGRGWLNYGLTLMRRGDYTQALACFEKALTLTPNYATLEINLSIVNDAMGRHAEAQKHFERALRLAPADDQARMFYGEWLLKNGDIDEAVKQLQTAVALNPSRDVAQQQLNFALAAQRGAIPVGASTKQLHDYWINVSLARYQKGDYEGALAAARRALAADANSALACNNIGAAEAGLHHWREAIAAESEALRLNPQMTIAQNNLQLYRSLQTAPQSSSQQQRAEAALNRSLDFYRDKRFSESLAAAKEALSLRPNYAEAYNNIAAANAMLARWDDAIAAAQKALSIKPDFPLAKNNLAWALDEKRKAIAK